MTYKKTRPVLWHRPRLFEEVREDLSCLIGILPFRRIRRNGGNARFGECFFKLGVQLIETGEQGLRAIRILRRGLEIVHLLLRRNGAGDDAHIRIFRRAVRIDAEALLEDVGIHVFRLGVARKGEVAQRVADIFAL